MGARHPDYVKQFGLGPEHISALIDIVQEWGDIEKRPDDDLFYAPVHAWRALGRLRAVEAIDPFLAMRNAMREQQGSSWYLEEFHDIFGLIGPPAIPALAAFLADQQNTEYPRASTASGLREIAKRHPETRSQVIEILTRQLANNESGAYDLNALLIDNLVNLEAVESAEVIERAYAADVVDETIIDWPYVCRKLGVKGLGLMSERKKKASRNMLPGFFPDHDISVPDQGDRDHQREREKKEKAKRKQQEKAKKRNRKKR